MLNKVVCCFPAASLPPKKATHTPSVSRSLSVLCSPSFRQVHHTSPSANAAHAAKHETDSYFLSLCPSPSRQILVFCHLSFIIRHRSCSTYTVATLSFDGYSGVHFLGYSHSARETQVMCVHGDENGHKTETCGLTQSG